jgi:hypothetical protein
LYGWALFQDLVGFEGREGTFVAIRDEDEMMEGEERV